MAAPEMGSQVTDTVTDSPPRAVNTTGETDPLFDEGVPAQDPPPRKQRSDKGKPRGPRKKRSSPLARKISEAVAMAAAGVATIDEFDSAILLANADRLGKSWAPVVDSSPRVKQFFESLERGGVWGAAIMSTACVALPIVANHAPELLPPPLRALAVSLIPSEIRARMTVHAEGQQVG